MLGRGNGKLLKSLQAGRAIAAMLVVFHHSALSVQGLITPLPHSIFNFLEFGYLGVDFFFALSGFIIFHATANANLSASVFVTRRLLRIYAPYLPIGILLACAYSLLPELSASGDRSWSWFASATLLPDGYPPALSVAWTLQHEVMFYGIFAALFFSGVLWQGIALWALCIALASVAGLELSLPLWKLLLAPINLEFIAGVVTAGLFASGRKISLQWTGAFIIVTIGIFRSVGATRNYSFIVGFGFAAAILFAAIREAQGKISVPSWMVFGGAASYAIYLVHNPALSLVSRVLGKIGFDHWLPSLVAAACISTLLGIAYHVAYERPALLVLGSALRKHLKRPADQPT